ncbi:MAG: glycosyltransferase [Planctomycetota bacterium]
MNSRPVNPKSILMVCRGLDPVGTGRQLEIVAAGFREARWDVHVAVTTSTGNVPMRLAQAGFPVYPIGGRPGVDFAAAAKLLRLVQRLAPTVIHAWGRSQARLVCGVRTLLPRPRVVCHLALGPRGALTGWLLRRADRVIAVSDGVGRHCKAMGVDAARIDIIPPGILPAGIAPEPHAASQGLGLSRESMAQRLGLPASSPWTLCIAPLVAEARLDRLLWAIDQLDVVHRGVEHVLVGDGPLRARILRRARVQQLSQRLLVLPHCDCLPDLLSQVRLVWQSGNVAYGGALLDAMAFGIPTLAVDSDAARQLILDQETGRIVSADPESELPRRALSMIEDDSLAARYGAAARARVHKYFSTAQSIPRHIAAVERSLET